MIRAKIRRWRARKCAGVWSHRQATRNGGPGFGTYHAYVNQLRQWHGLPPIP